MRNQTTVMLLLFFLCEDGKNSTRHLRISLTLKLSHTLFFWNYMMTCEYVEVNAYCLIFARVIVMKSSCFHFKKSKHHNDDNNGKIPHINNEWKIYSDRVNGNFHRDVYVTTESRKMNNLWRFGMKEYKLVVIKYYVTSCEGEKRIIFVSCHIRTFPQSNSPFLSLSPFSFTLHLVSFQHSESNCNFRFYTSRRKCRKHQH